MIPMDWIVKSAKQIAEPVRGGSPRPAGDPRFFNGQFMPWLTVASLTNVPQSQLVVSETASSLTEEGTNYSRTLQPGTLIIANSGATLGVAKILGIKCCANDGIAALLRLDQDVCPKYLAYFINTQTKMLREVVATGNGQPNLNTALIGDLKFPLPPSRKEQEAIAETLSDADALIESLSQLLTKKRQIKQGAMQELLTGKKRLPGFVDSWGSVTIGSFTDCTAGGTPSTNIETYWGGDIPWMSSGDLHLKHVKDIEGRITDEGLRSSSTKWIPVGCVLIGLAGQGKTRGTVAMNHVPLCTNQSIAAIFPVDSYDSLFLYFNLESRYEELRELSAGDGGRGGLNLSLIRNLAVPMPCLIEQREIARVLADIDSDVASVEEKLAKARDIKQGMMQALLTGRIRLVQPASSVIQLLTKPAPIRPSSAQATHNWQINEAVVIGVLAQRFGSEKMPLGRKRRVKLTYLLHRHAEGRAEGYLKNAAGPYNPNTKYKGPEQIALKNGYVRALRNEKYEGFVAGEKIEQAQRYFEQWYGEAALAWLERFHYRKTEELELLATVDMAMVDLAASGELTDVASVKRIIAAHPEWLPKLSRELFSDERIAATIAECRTILGG
ncbi:restriction endonuclease subunit S [Dyella marensis]|nr:MULTISPECIES: restriction endonuclease subunit S [Dyella]